MLDAMHYKMVRSDMVVKIWWSNTINYIIGNIFKGWKH